uniref:Uncharacterized protein n=1 Tax=Oryza sativa subsp. japonica TaxID=39947 RepID=Q7F1E9_ORYSJ|nr:hypothetical protein [Oryza sativa Japonica Group]
MAEEEVKEAEAVKVEVQPFWVRGEKKLFFQTADTAPGAFITDMSHVSDKGTMPLKAKDFNPRWRGLGWEAKRSSNLLLSDFE